MLLLEIIFDKLDVKFWCRIHLTNVQTRWNKSFCAHGEEEELY
jgi:hypothetical protein